MSTVGSYPVSSFSPSQYFLIYNPSTQTLDRVLGSELVTYVTQNADYVRAVSTRAVAQTLDFDIGIIVQTGGDLLPGDGGQGTFLVVASGSGTYTMDNGNELLLLPFGSLAGSNLDDALVTDGISQVAIESAIERRGVLAASYGATGDGTTDDSSAISTADAAGYTIFNAGTYRISTNTTLSNPVDMRPGAKFSVDSGVTLTINAPVSANVAEIFSGSGSVAGTFGGVVVLEEWFASTVTNATTVSPRPQYTSGTLTLTYGTDASTPSELIRKIPVNLQHNVNIVFPAGTAYQTHDIVIPKVYSTRFNDTETGLAKRTSGGHITIQSSSAGTFAEIGSIWFAGGQCPVTVDDIKTTKEGPYADGDAPFEARGNLEIIVQEFEATDTNSGVASPINRVFSSYDPGGIIDTKGPIAVGTNKFKHFGVPKRGGSVHASLENGGTGTLTGALMWNQDGNLCSINRAGGLTGTVDDSPSAISKDRAGPVWSYDGDNPNDYNLRLEGAEQEIHISGSSRTTGSIPAGSNERMQQFDVTIPGGHKFVLHAARYWLGHPDFRIVANIGGTDQWTSSADSGDEAPADVIYDNSGSGTPTTQTIQIRINNTNAGSQSLVGYDGWALQFRITTLE